MSYQNMVALNKTIADVKANFERTLSYYGASHSDIEIGDFDHRKRWFQGKIDHEETAYRLTWFTGKGYQVYMFMTGCLVSNPDEHEENCRCVDCETSPKLRKN